MSLADRLDDVIKNGCYCVVGSKNQVDSMGDILMMYKCCAMLIDKVLTTD